MNWFVILLVVIALLGVYDVFILPVYQAWANHRSRINEAKMPKFTVIDLREKGE